MIVIEDLRRQISNLAAYLGTFFGEIIAKNGSLPTDWMEQEKQQADGGGFTSAIGFNKTKNLAIPDRQAQLLDGAGYTLILVH